MATGICAGVLLALSSASAATVNSTFGSLSQATFGGSGIPNGSVQITTITNIGATLDGITLGLTATPRYVAGELANNGSDTFYAVAGSQWNFDFYASIAGGGTLANYSFKLLYGYAGTAMADLGVWNLNAGQPTTGTLLQDSEYPGFSFLSTGVAGAVTPPTGGFTFNPNNTQNYVFYLQSFDAGNTMLGQSAINVNVAPVPEPSSLALVGLGGGFATLLGFRNRRKH